MPVVFNQVASMSSSMTAIAMRSGVNEEAFEKFMKDEVFPSINLATRLFENRHHVLLKSDQKVEGNSLYLWTIFATTTNPTQGESHFVNLLDLDTRARLTEQLKPYGAFVGFTDKS